MAFQQHGDPKPVCRLSGSPRGIRRNHRRVPRQKRRELANVRRDHDRSSALGVTAYARTVENDRHRLRQRRGDRGSRRLVRVVCTDPGTDQPRLHTARHVNRFWSALQYKFTHRWRPEITNHTDTGTKCGLYTEDRSPGILD